MAKRREDERWRADAEAASAPWFKMWVDDWLSSTAIAQMTAAEERGYLRLLMHAWKPNPTTGKPPCALPNDPATLQRLALMTDVEWQQGRGRVMGLFTLIGNGKWVRNLRQWKEWQAMVAEAEKKRAAGSKGGQRTKSRRSSEPPASDTDDAR